MRLLQTLTLLTTTNGVCQGECLARCLVICFRLAFSKDGTVSGGSLIFHYVCLPEKNIPPNQCHLQFLILALSHGRSHCATPCNCCIRPLPSLPTFNKACHRSSTVSTQVLLVFSQSDKLKNIFCVLVSLFKI